MKNKKLTIALATAAAVISLGGLSACSSNSANKDIVTLKGDTITVTDFYNEAKEFPAQTSQQVLTNLTFTKIFEKEFGKEVTDKTVQAEVDKYKKQYGDQFASVLQQSNLTTENFKDFEKTQLLAQAAIKDDIKKTQYTDANLKSVWATYHPEVEAIVLSKTSKDDAQKAIDANKANASKFDSDNAKSKMTFDSGTDKVPAEVLAKTFSLANGKMSDVITATNTSTGASEYYVVKMIKTSEKGKDMNKYKKELENIIQTQKLADSSYTMSVIGKYLKQYNVTVKDQAFQNIFSNYTGTSSSSSTSK
ncbi:foldase [Lactococcus termiticola]|uniref:Foldase protein PrsA n=1 Tax=Lactococcus termiticola TaxID=2169526 RepID=A0A2R5HI46_9LACT|nr:foldase [Lactococcus termiticola]GBG95920.1 peptidylprolyl isomerase [Lactococcus termiticola]